MKIFKNLFAFWLVLSMTGFVISCNPNSKGNTTRSATVKLVDNSAANDSSSELVANSDSIYNSRNQFKIVSWNIRDLGRSKILKDIEQIAHVIKEADLVLIQEVVAKDPAGAQAIAKIADNLNRLGSKWDYATSNPTESPSANMSERYAFLWKTSKVRLLNEPNLASNYKDVIYREPFLANFKFKNKSNPISVVNFHSRKHNDNPEHEIKYFVDIQSKLKYKTVIIAGDFNLDESHKVWQPLYDLGFKNALFKTRTTLKKKCSFGDYKNHAIDNIYYNNGIDKIEAKVIDLVKTCDNLEEIRRLSDHLPVQLIFY